MFGLFGKRKNILINPKFQLTYLLHSVAVVLLSVLFLYGSVRYALHMSLQRAIESGLHPDHILFAVLRDVQSEINLNFVVGSLIAALAIILYGLVLSHRIAGPIYRLRSHLRSSDAAQPLSFRKNDYFLEVVEDFNKYQERLSEKKP